MLFLWPRFGRWLSLKRSVQLVSPHEKFPVLFFLHLADLVRFYPSLISNRKVETLVCFYEVRVVPQFCNVGLCCGHREHCVLAGRGLYQCNRCKKQTSPTAGTIFHATKLPLTLWFAAIHLIVTAKNGISSVELGRRLGVKQPTAWAVKHKIMAVMARREGETALLERFYFKDYSSFIQKKIRTLSIR